jgi:hypothetical protein
MRLPDHVPDRTRVIVAPWLKPESTDTAHGLSAIHGTHAVRA